MPGYNCPMSAVVSLRIITGAAASQDSNYYNYIIRFSMPCWLNGTSQQPIPSQREGAGERTNAMRQYASSGGDNMRRCGLVYVVVLFVILLYSSVAICVCWSYKINIADRLSCLVSNSETYVDEYLLCMQTCVATFYEYSYVVVNYVSPPSQWVYRAEWTEPKHNIRGVSTGMYVLLDYPSSACTWHTSCPPCLYTSIIPISPFQLQNVHSGASRTKRHKIETPLCLYYIFYLQCILHIL